MPTPPVDQINYCVVPICAMLNDMELSDATGFLFAGTVDGTPTHWLITNWHVLSGRNASNPSTFMHRHGALPDRLRLKVPRETDGSGNRVEGWLFLEEKFISLYDENDCAVWYQHKNQNNVDVAVINMGGSLCETMVKGINEQARQNDMAIEIGNDVFILGYPLGFRMFFTTPIWKRGSIASEPHAETPENVDKIVIDATTRAGMSGSPVIMRYKTHYLSESGEVKISPNATRFVGVYASRPAPQPLVNNQGIDSDQRHELGYVFKSGVVDEIIRDGIRGLSYGQVP